MAKKRPLRLEEVEFEYLKIDLWAVSQSSGRGNEFGVVTSLVPCADCGGPAEDGTKNLQGETMPSVKNSVELFGDEPFCDQCIMEDQAQELEGDVLALLETKPGLGEEDRLALKSVVQTIFTDPAKILRVERTENRVSALEGQIKTFWVVLGIAAGLIAVLIAAVIAIALALAS